jgi:hypothetical protein
LSSRNKEIIPLFTKRFLLEVRKKALRRGKWYKILDNLERGILSLASQIIANVHNSLLNTQIVGILAKLNDSLKTDFAKHVETFGDRRLKEIQAQAKRFTQLKSLLMENDVDFLRYLIFLDYNQPMEFRRFV